MALSLVKKSAKRPTDAPGWIVYVSMKLRVCFETVGTVVTVAVHLSLCIEIRVVISLGNAKSRKMASHDTESSFRRRIDLV